ncbi:MAG: carboxylating nicotinate-nucleotide diphosphorylase, partial [Bacteroidota bacterium]|nr:carboxylating nicotinate-nucleotide diphosphorylase [Bacteroidota bacterium]
MKNQAVFNIEIENIIANAIREDVGSGDHSSMACIPTKAFGKARLLVKDKGVLAGVKFAEKVFSYVDPKLHFVVKIKDGAHVKYGNIAFEVMGSKQSILKAERVVLNAMQRMSAIATKTEKFVRILEGTKTKILDTRKTTPGIRALEKWAVSIGGGTNHRFALDDMIMLKDNHIDFTGSITNALEQTVSYLKLNKLDLKIVVEARDLDEIQEILNHGGAHRILIDNFGIHETKMAVKLIGNDCEIESSGGINEETLRH